MNGINFKAFLATGQSLQRTSIMRESLGLHGFKTRFSSVSRKHLVFLTVLSSTLMAQFAGAQAEHSIQSGSYNLRATALNSEVIPASVAREHGIERAPDRGALNVVVLKKMPDGQSITVPAAITAYQRNLIGQREKIDMRSVTENNRVSYFGTFELSLSNDLYFSVEAKPQDSGDTITLEFEDQF